MLLVSLLSIALHTGNGSRIIVSVEAKAETSTYEDMTEAPPVSYESISASPHQNSGAQPKANHRIEYLYP